MTLNLMVFESLGNVENPFIAIPSKSNQTFVKAPFMGQLELFNHLIIYYSENNFTLRKQMINIKLNDVTVLETI